MNKYTTTLLIAVSLSGIASLAQPPVNQAAAKVDFEKQVLPIFKDKCLKCHEKEHTDEKGALKKPKGGLVMSTAEGLKKGGKESKEKTLVAGKADESTLYKSVMLPSSDDAAMPPDGKGDPLTDAEKELLKSWINQGADFGAWK
ncbi:MAG: hypothetical protein RL693_130 [Verrucomicrobiota bacterium]